jgi:hypothetical protein
MATVQQALGKRLLFTKICVPKSINQAPKGLVIEGPIRRGYYGIGYRIKLRVLGFRRGLHPVFTGEISLCLRHSTKAETEEGEWQPN